MHAVCSLLCADCCAGGSKALSYPEACQQHSGLPADGLVQLVQQALSRVQQMGGVGAQVMLLCGVP
jgi:hypothetical protein